MPHFRLSILRGVGAWDPYNVTEDADLGIRLARVGYRTATIASTTWEEAPVHRGVWIGQRTRWLKGWLQTWPVHTRHPLRLFNEVGARQFFGLLVVFGGVLLSVLVYPVALFAMMLAWLLGGFDNVELAGHGSWLRILALTNLTIGILAPMLAAALATVRRRRPRLLLSVIWMPAYWVLISFAGYRALIDFIRRPYYWEKTRHGLGGVQKRAPLSLPHGRSPSQPRVRAPRSQTAPPPLTLREALRL